MSSLLRGYRLVLLRLLLLLLLLEVVVVVHPRFRWDGEEGEEEGGVLLPGGEEGKEGEGARGGRPAFG